jgi:hypothetical protein
MVTRIKRFAITVILVFFAVISKSQDVSVNYTKSISKADSEFIKENYKVAAELYEKTFVENNNMGMVRDRIKVACCYSLLKNNDSAFFHLNRVVKFGHYYDYNKLLNEKKFINLHEDERWLNLISQMKMQDEKMLELLKNSTIEE